MDRYYGDLARSVLSEAEKQIVKAQNYLIDSKANDHLHTKAARLLRMVRSLQDEIHAAAMDEDNREEPCQS